MSPARNYSTPWTDFYQPNKGPYGKHRITIISYGPEHLHAREEPETLFGPAYFTAQHPELFGTGSTSAHEGWFYWALLQPDVRGPEGPEGGWQYQRKVRPGGAKVGATTVDFVINSRPRPIACRIVTPWFHLGFGPEKAATDAEQVWMLQEQGYDVYDAFSSLYMNDRGGETVKEHALRVIRKDPALSPLSATYLGNR